MATITMAATTNMPTTTNNTATVAVVKTYKYTMDAGIVNFTCTLGLTDNTWTSAEYALI